MQDPPLVCIRKGRHSSRRTHTKSQPSKIFWTCESSLDQNHWIRQSQCKIFRIALLEMQNRLDLIGDGGSGPCTTSRLTAHLCQVGRTGLRLSNGGGKLG
jgi:hypothetical protein